jgi:glycerol kinase
VRPTPPVWRSVSGRTSKIRANWGKDKEWKPAMDPALREKEYKGWKKAVTRTFDWVE